MCFFVVDDTLRQLKKKTGRGSPITVLDLCSGKGGDLLKWKKGEIDYLVCAGSAAILRCSVQLRSLEMFFDLHCSKGFIPNGERVNHYWNYRWRKKCVIANDCALFRLLLQ